MKKIIGSLLVLSLFFGCATKLKPMKSPEDFQDSTTYLYGFARISGASHFGLYFQNLNTKESFRITRSWIWIPFWTKKILFSVKLDPGFYEFNRMHVSRGGEGGVYLGDKYKFEVEKGKGNFFGLIDATNDPLAMFNNASNEINEQNKEFVDGLMENKYPAFIRQNTTLLSVIHPDSI